MNNIKSVTIEKLWGIKDISTNFHESVNIFIGSNGSSKTTFLKLIEATLLVDVNTLTDIDFEKIIINFNSLDINELIVLKNISDEMPVLLYKFNDGTELEIPCISAIRSYRTHAKYRESSDQIRTKLNSMVNISWLSVNRDNIDSKNYERRDILETFKSTIDIKLQELMNDLVVYQLHIESEANKIATGFKEDVLSLMLYNKDNDIYNNNIIDKFTSVDTQLMKRDLFKAFQALGVARDKADLIKGHIESINSVIAKIKKEQSIDINDAFVLSLINRTLSIIEISKDNEAQIDVINKPMSNFWDCLKKFMLNKEFTLKSEVGEGIKIVLKEGNGKYNTPINITSLSSGEKQLFILLTEALLQREKPYLFIADEPELSLHIEWQQKVLGELLKLNPNAQIIVATHSPEIASAFPENAINMKNIIRYE